MEELQDVIIKTEKELQGDISNIGIHKSIVHLCLNNI